MMNSAAPSPSIADLCWIESIEKIAALIARHSPHPAETVVLLPYIQLIAQARRVWGQFAGQNGRALFLPRFETTQTWGERERSAQPVEASPDDLRMDKALDTLTAERLIARAQLGSQGAPLAMRLVEQAWSLARIAASIAPQERLAWGERIGGLLLGESLAPALRLETAIGATALAWAATSRYPTDALFEARPALLVVLQGFQPDPLAKALLAHSGERAVQLTLCAPIAPDAPCRPALQPASNAEDEATRAAACVLVHLVQGRSPVALVAQDRLLTRRVGAILHASGVAMRDETGWKLSTTRAAASVMSLLQAMKRDASSDGVIDWLKNAPAFTAQADGVEAELRRAGVRAWRELPDFAQPVSAAPDHAQAQGEALKPKFSQTAQLAGPIDAFRAQLAEPRALAAWLVDLHGALVDAGQWPGLLRDEAGQAVLTALRLHPGAEAEFDGAPAMTLTGFIHWAGVVLEGANFSPPHPPPDEPNQVIIMPLGQLLGRSVQAVVLPGCDEIRLPVSPEPPGQWTPAQRELLGLPARQVLALEARAAWTYALQHAHVDVLWRESENGECLMPSGFVQQLQLDQRGINAPDSRLARSIDTRPTPRPLPTGAALPVAQLSASAYEDLRRCPYRFFALRQLNLREPDELDGEVTKRDFGNWLHTLLHHFHTALAEAPTTEADERLAMIDAAADRATHELHLSEAEFLPFAASWPGVRGGYLEWLTAHEAKGAIYEDGEVWREMPYGKLKLVGKLDRIDSVGGEKMVLDYKTEPQSRTSKRIASGNEDTQIGFYAALFDADTLQAAYVNVGEKGETRSFAQPEIVALRDDLISGILSDMAAIAGGAAMPALGEGEACSFCAARGLCRKDFWNE